MATNLLMMIEPLNETFFSYKKDDHTRHVSPYIAKS